MTIKQNGGIFGRNPTFNNLDVEGTLTVDTDTLYVDATNDRVGVNISFTDRSSSCKWKHYFK